MIKFLNILFVLCSCFVYSQDTLLLTERLAFPEAKGYGKYASGGNDGQIIHVTNLNDSGAGSLRQALQFTTGPRTIVFDVGGDINLLSAITVGNTTASTADYANITIAGQTAPLPGITIKNDEIYLQTGNVIMRYLTFRSVGGLFPASENPNNILLRNWGGGGYQMDGFVFDHLTMSHAGNEAWGGGSYLDGIYIRNITLSNCMIGKVENGDGAILRADNMNNFSMIENYLHHEESRLPNIGYGTNSPLENIEIINIHSPPSGPRLTFSIKSAYIHSLHSPNSKNSWLKIREANTKSNSMLQNIN